MVCARWTGPKNRGWARLRGERASAGEPTRHAESVRHDVSLRLIGRIGRVVRGDHHVASGIVVDNADIRRAIDTELRRRLGLLKEEPAAAPEVAAAAKPGAAARR